MSREGGHDQRERTARAKAWGLLWESKWCTKTGILLQWEGLEKVGKGSDLESWLCVYSKGTGSSGDRLTHNHISILGRTVRTGRKVNCSGINILSSYSSCSGSRPASFELEL